MFSFKKFFLFTLLVCVCSQASAMLSEVVVKDELVEPDMAEIYFYAVKNGFVDSVKTLIKYGFDVNSKIRRPDCKNEVSALLHVAVEYNHMDVAEILLSAGADINAQTVNAKATPLHIATFMGNFAMVWFLLIKDANVRLLDCRGRNPYDIAERKGHKNISGLISARSLRLLAKRQKESE